MNSSETDRGKERGRPGAVLGCGQGVEADVGRVPPGPGRAGAVTMQSQENRRGRICNCFPATAEGMKVGGGRDEERAAHSYLPPPSGQTRPSHAAATY